MIRPLGKDWTLDQWLEYEEQCRVKARRELIILSLLPIGFIVGLIINVVVKVV